MKNKSPLDAIFLLLFLLFSVAYVVEIICWEIRQPDMEVYLLRLLYHYAVRPLGYLLSGYAVSWLLLVPLAAAPFSLPHGARAAAFLAAGLMTAGYLAFAWYLWNGSVPIPSTIREIHDEAFFMVLPGLFLCAALRPGQGREEN